MSEDNTRRRRMRWRIGITVVLLVVVVAAAAIVIINERLNEDPVRLSTGNGEADATEEAADPVPRFEIAYNSNRDGDWDIFLLATDGTLINLTGDDSGGHDYFPSFSFQSDMINFITGRTGEMGPGQVRPDGSDLRTLDIASAVMSTVGEGRLDWDPSWSPDGATILWASLRDLNLELYTMDAATNENRLRLTAAFSRDWFMTWAPDGATIALLSDREDDEDVYVIDATGENLTRLTEFANDELHPMFSLDGTKILFISQADESAVDGELDWWIMNVDGSDLRRFEDGEVFRGDPTYSPDGRQMLYVSNEGGTWGLYLQNTSGGPAVRLSDPEHDALFPVWRPVPESDDADAEATEES